ncbi:high nitrogen upregulated cytochrome P450 monooxygenase 2 [Gloeopeniophorella convolvens]|nr:high nitrogen upregulated cytochrome P450 monooxygenase 2 [Gloeopeniophorella convolvens]
MLHLCTSLAAYLYFKQFEPWRLPTLIALLAAPPAVFSTLLVHDAFFVGRVFEFLASFCIYNALILSYTAIYRLSPWHPLAKYPGPTLAKLSKWYSVVICASGNQLQHYRALHDRYGDHVRVGPNELSIRDASAIHSVLGPGGLQKGPFFDHRPTSLINTRDATDHSRRRKMWTRGFSTSALKEYEAFVFKRLRQLVIKIDSLVQEAANEKREALLDIASWFEFFSTDFMGDMAFGGGFELMDSNGDKKTTWNIVQAGLKNAAVLGHISWFRPLAQYIPGTTSKDRHMREFAKDCVVRRMQMGTDRKDLFYHLSGEERPPEARPPLPAVVSDGLVAIIAGSDTTSTILSALFNQLIQNKDAYERLRDEISQEFPDGEEPVDITRLSQLPWLNACIHEALRLYPPVPSGSQRYVLRGSGPKIVGDHIIPEQTQLILNTYMIQRDPRNFSAPDSFLPQRWLASKSEDPASSGITVHNAAAFFPFSYGETSCVGKNLAFLEMRIVAAWLVQRYDFRLPSAGKVGKWEDHFEDYVVLRKGPLVVRVAPRI